MAVQQAQQLAAEAAALVERIQAAKHEAGKARNFERVWRLQQAGFRARARWMRRLDKWSVASYDEEAR